MLRIITLLAAIVATPPTAGTQPRAVYEGPAFVVDADKLIVGTDHIELFGVDAVERYNVCEDGAGRRDECGRRVAEELAQRIANKPVRCTFVAWRPSRVATEPDRAIAQCSAPAIGDIAHWLVVSGYAVASDSGSPYSAEVMGACQARTGLWAGAWLDPAVERQRRSGADRGPRWLGHRAKAPCIHALRSAGGAPLLLK